MDCKEYVAINTLEGLFSRSRLLVGEAPPFSTQQWVSTRQIRDRRIKRYCLLGHNASIHQLLTGDIMQTGNSLTGRFGSCDQRGGRDSRTQNFKHEAEQNHREPTRPIFMFWLWASSVLLDSKLTIFIPIWQQKEKRTSLSCSQVVESLLFVKRCCFVKRVWHLVHREQNTLQTDWQLKNTVP